MGATYPHLGYYASKIHGILELLAAPNADRRQRLSWAYDGILELPQCDLPPDIEASLTAIAARLRIHEMSDASERSVYRHLSGVGWRDREKLCCEIVGFCLTVVRAAERQASQQT